MVVEAQEQKMDPVIAIMGETETQLVAEVVVEAAEAMLLEETLVSFDGP
jgi:hypothetical protein